MKKIILLGIARIYLFSFTGTSELQVSDNNQPVRYNYRIDDAIGIGPADSGWTRPHEFYDNNFIIPQSQNFDINESSENFSDYINVNISNDSMPQNEPSVNISYKDTNRIVAAWRDFRTGYNPLIRRVGYGYSTNGGITWSVSQLLPQLDPVHRRASDPAVASDTAGNFYISTISVDTNNSDGIVLVYKSTDQGLTFNTAVNVAPHIPNIYLDDKDYITCDLSIDSPYRNTLYITWSRSFNYQSSKILLVRSTNSGLSWSGPFVVLDSVNNNGGSGSVPATDRNGNLYVIWTGWISYVLGIYISKSTNGGLNFSQPVLIDTWTDYAGFPSVAIDNSGGPRDGFIYATWVNTISNDMDVYFSYSSNHGNSWLHLSIRVNNDPPGTPQLYPWMTCNNNGNIFIIYHNGRDVGAQYAFNEFLARSTDGGFDFILEQITNQQSIWGTPYTGGHYIGIYSRAQKIVPVWTDGRAGGINSEIYASVIYDTPTGIKPISNELPNKFFLSQNYPNPFNASTKFKFQIAKLSKVKIVIYNILGSEVATLVNEELKHGTYEVEWEATNYPSGVYYYRLTAGDYIETRKMVLIK